MMFYWMFISMIFFAIGSTFSKNFNCTVHDNWRLIENGYFTVINAPPVVRLSFHCENNFRLNGPPVKLCINGQWYPPGQIMCKKTRDRRSILRRSPLITKLRKADEGIGTMISEPTSISIESRSMKIIDSPSIPTEIRHSILVTKRKNCTGTCSTKSNLKIGPIAKSAAKADTTISGQNSAATGDYVIFDEKIISGASSEYHTQSLSNYANRGYGDANSPTIMGRKSILIKPKLPVFIESKPISVDHQLLEFPTTGANNQASSKSTNRGKIGANSGSHNLTKDKVGPTDQNTTLSSKKSVIAVSVTNRSPNSANKKPVNWATRGTIVTVLNKKLPNQSLIKRKLNVTSTVGANTEERVSSTGHHSDEVPILVAANHKKYPYTSQLSERLSTEYAQYWINPSKVSTKLDTAASGGRGRPLSIDFDHLQVNSERDHLSAGEITIVRNTHQPPYSTKDKPTNLTIVHKNIIVHRPGDADNNNQILNRNIWPMIIGYNTTQGTPVYIQSLTVTGNPYLNESGTQLWPPYELLVTPTAPVPVYVSPRPLPPQIIPQQTVAPPQIINQQTVVPPQIIHQQTVVPPPTPKPPHEMNPQTQIIVENVNQPKPSPSMDSYYYVPPPSQHHHVHHRPPLHRPSTLSTDSLLALFGVDTLGGLFTKISVFKLLLFTILVMFLPPLTLAAVIANSYG